MAVRVFTYHRIVGYVATLAMHLGNGIYTSNAMQKKIVIYPDLKIFEEFVPRYLTIWNTVFQTFNAFVGLYIELRTLEGKRNQVPEKLIHFKQTFLNSIVFPYTVLVFTLFWPIFFYDRNLVFPTRADLFMTKFANLILHFFILPVAVWDVVFQESTYRTSHKNNCVYIFGMYCIYNSVLFFTRYGDIGVWPYHILTVLEGGIFFPLFFLYIFVTLYAAYYMQWRIQTAFWAWVDKINLKKI